MLYAVCGCPCNAPAQCYYYVYLVRNMANIQARRLGQCNFDQAEDLYNTRCKIRSHSYQFLATLKKSLPTLQLL